jgi:hypothetical protein
MALRKSEGEINANKPPTTPAIPSDDPAPSEPQKYAKISARIPGMK